MTSERYPVAIIGGGPVGLIASILLSQAKIPHILFERYPSTSIHPKACGLNQRTMEIFRHMGIEQDVLQHRAPAGTTRRTAWYTSYGPNGREIASRDSWGGGQFVEEYRRVSPSPYSILPQIRLEPILQKRALELNHGKVRYNSEVVNVKEKNDRVILRVKHEGEMDLTTYEATYVIGADGGRGLTDSLGIKWEGERNIVDMVSAHIRARITPEHPDPSVFISWFIDPLSGGSISTGYLYHLGPYPATPDTEEWVFACARNPDDPNKFTEEDMRKRMATTLKLPNLEVTFLSLSHWHVNAITAERYRSQSGRIFLVGDAAHRIPPWGAIGLNTGIQDIYNLLWKLQISLNRQDTHDCSALLDTYETERKPVGVRVGKTSLHNLRSHSAEIDVAIGLSPKNSTEQNVHAMDSYFYDTTTDGAMRRQAVTSALKTLDSEFHALGNEMGWFYPSVDVDKEGEATRHGGQLKESGEFDIIDYYPSAIPGHHLPHVWIEKGGVRKSTVDLLLPDRFILLALGGNWEKLSGSLVHVEVVDESRGWKTNRHDLQSLLGIEGSGAVLVRPDGIVAWRAQNDEFTREDDAARNLAALIERRVLKCPRLLSTKI